MQIKEAFIGFSKPSIAIDCVVLRTQDIYKRPYSPKNIQVLLVRKPDEAEWHLPGTILRLGETSKDAFDRLFINTEDIVFEQLYTVLDNLERDERGHIISVVYIGIVNELIDVITKNGLECQWFWVSSKDINTKQRKFKGTKTDLELTNLKYDHHNIISDTILRIQSKLMYTDIGFNFIEKEFTIRKLEDTFTAINERVIPAFRRTILNKLVGLNKKVDGRANRPAELFRKKEDTD